MNNNKLAKAMELMKPFSGEEDVESWLLREEMIVQMQGVKDEEKLLPLLLEGNALLVFMEMSEEERGSAGKIKERLRNSFGIDPFTAYKGFCNKKWKGEPLEVFFAELKKLARAAKISSEMILKRAFIAGMPNEIEKDLRSMEKVEECELEEVLSKARSLINSRRMECKSGRSYNEKGLLKCFSCGGNHLKRDCWRVGIKCFSCGGRGHIQKYCNQGNGESGAIAEEIAP